MPMTTLRVVSYVLLLLVCIGWVIVLALVISASRPEPGANMVLMGVPLVAAPMALLAGLLLAIGSTAGRSLNLWERWLFGLAGGATLAAALLAWLFG